MYYGKVLGKRVAFTNRVWDELRRRFNTKLYTYDKVYRAYVMEEVCPLCKPGLDGYIRMCTICALHKFQNDDTTSGCYVALRALLGRRELFRIGLYSVAYKTKKQKEQIDTIYRALGRMKKK